MRDDGGEKREADATGVEGRREEIRMPRKYREHNNQK